MTRLKTYFLLIPGVLFFCGIYSQETYRAIPWDVEQGLSIGGRNCMLKDKNGFLWIGTNVGLNRFDGNHFTNYFSDKNKSGTIISDLIFGLIEDSLHNIWIGTQKGLSRYDIRADTFSRYWTPGGLAAGTPYTNPFWATRDEVFCIEMNVRITAYNIHTFKRRIVVDHFFRNNPVNIIGFPASISFFPINSILDIRNNSVWMLDQAGLSEVSLTTGKHNLYSFSCNRKLKPPSYEHVSKGMCYDPKNNLIWLNTSDGLVQFNPGTKKFFHIEAFNKIVNEKENLKDFYHPGHGISLDREGRIWMATFPKGIFMYDPARNLITQPFTDTDRQNFSHDATAFYCDRDGIAWVSGERKAFYQFIPDRPSVIHYTANPNKPFSLSHNHVATIVMGPQDKLWIGTFDGINIFDPATGLFQVLREKDLPGFKGKNIMPLAIDASLRKTWLKAWYPDVIFEMDVATRKCRSITVSDTSHHKINLSYMSAEAAKPYKNGFIFPVEGAGLFLVTSDNLIARQILTGSQFIGKIVVGNNHYLFIRAPNAPNNITYTERNGQWILTPNPLDSIEWSTIFFNREDQTWWVGGRREIIHYDKDFHVIRRYTDGFPGIDVLSILADNDGNIWFVIRTGHIARLEPKSGKFLTLSKVDGFQKQIFVGDHAHAKDAAGNLYFGSYDGLYRVDPDKFVKSYPPSTVYLKSIGVNQKPFTASGSLNYIKEVSLKHNENNVTVETGVIDYYSENSTRIRYKLEGLHQNWLYAPSQAALTFDGLQPRKYKLIIQASNAVDDFNAPEKILLIHIHSPFWTTWWFRGTALLVLIASIYGIIRWRLRQKFQQQLKQSEKEKQVAELQQQKTELEMQALRAQMNPHFIFNSLNSINRFILQNNKTQASEYLTKFSKLVRMILQNSQASLITLENELESLELYLELEALRFEYRFGYKISIPKDMDADVLKVPPLIIQPFAENAIWHGLMHKEEKGQLDIEVSQASDLLFFRIADNGIGRKAAAELRSKSATRHKSVGLKITADRIAMVNSSNGSGSVVTINDLVNSDGNAAGTEVIIKIPVLYS